MNQQSEKEGKRLEALWRLKLLDTPAEQAVDEITALAASVCGSPIAFVSLVDRHRVWFKSRVGLSFEEDSRDNSFCNVTILDRDVVVVENAAMDHRFSNHPWVKTGPRIRFYAGAPLVTSEGLAIGSLGIMDSVSRKMSEESRQALRVLSRQVMAQFELRRHLSRPAQIAPITNPLRSSVLFRSTRPYSQERLPNPPLDVRYQRLVDSGLVGVIVAGTDGSIKEANDYFLNLVGHSREEVEAGTLRWDTMTPEEWIEVDLEKLEELKATGTSGPFEKEYFHKLGHRVHIILSVALLDGPDQEAICLIVDTSRRKRTEDALRESEARARAMADFSPIGIFVSSPDGQIVYDNFAVRQVLGLSSDPLIEDHWVDSIHPEDRTRVLSAWSDFVSAKHPTYDIEFRFVRPDKTIRFVHARATRVYDRDCLLGFTGSAEDITERKHAESALRDSEELWKFALEGAGDGVWDLNVPTQVVRYSKRWKEMLGYEATDIEDHFEAWANICHPDDLPRALADYQAYLDKKTPAYVNEHRLRCKDGSYKWILARGMAVNYESDGSPLRIVGTHCDISERKHADAASKLRNDALDHSLSGFDIVDERGEFVYVNRAYLDLWGYMSLEEVRGTQASSHCADSSIPARIIETLKADGSCTIEFTAKRKDGSTFEARMAARLFHDADGHELYTGDTIDLTEQKRSQERIQSLNRTYAVLTNINQLIVRVHDQQTILEGACRIAVEQGGFLLAWIDFEDPSSRQTAYVSANNENSAELESELCESQTRCPFTIEARTSGRHVVCNDLLNHPSTAPSCAVTITRGYKAMVSLPLMIDERPCGNFNLYAGTVDFFDDEEMKLLDRLAADISLAMELGRRGKAREAAEEKLRESEERFRQVAENIREVLRLTDPKDARLLYVSPAYEMIWGLSCESLYETPDSWRDAVHPEDQEQVSHAISTKLPACEYDEIYRIIRPDGSVRWIRDRAFPIRDRSGDIYRIVGTAEDITQHRQLEEQYRQSQKLEAVGRLAGGVAHDFNNILAAMMIQAELVSESKNLSSDEFVLMQDLRNSAERAASLTRQLLAFSRLQVMQPQVMDLNDVVNQLSKMLERIVSEDVNLQLNLAAEPLITRFDAGMLDQLLMNLVVNARDAMPGGGRVLIETERRTLSDEEAREIPDATPGPHVCLSVSDSGCGIPQEEIPRIFEPFFTTKEAGKGTGLGLATVFGIVKQHHGSLLVESEVGQGTTFQVFLPTITKTTPSKAQSIPPKDGSLRGHETVLLVEDEPSVRTLTRTVLERNGYRVLEAAHGIEALQLWENFSDPIHLLLTDIVMPKGVNGWELAAELEAKGRLPKLRVIFISGYSAEAAGREITLLKGQDFIQKPCPPQDLLRIVRRCLDA